MLTGTVVLSDPLGPLTDMTVKGIAARVSAIGLLDAEGAHYEEDEAYKAVLHAIADGSVSNPAELAREVLRIDELPFSRWYA